MPNRRWAIIWTNADPIHGCIYVALGGDELMKWATGRSCGWLSSDNYNASPKSSQKTPIACPLGRDMGCLLWTLDSYLYSASVILRKKIGPCYNGTPLYFLSLECLNSLWPGDAIWPHGTKSTLAQVMACCLTAPSHSLNQCWLNINGVLWYSPYNNFTSSARVISK